MEALDARLRAHRPRAGRVEEGDRAARADELVSQRRRAERHMAEQSKAVKRQRVRVTSRGRGATGRALAQLP